MRGLLTKKKLWQEKISFQIFVYLGIRYIQFQKQVTGTFFHYRVSFAENFQQFSAFALEKKLEKHGVRACQVYCIEKIKTIKNTISALLFIIIKNIEPTPI